MCASPRLAPLEPLFAAWVVAVAIACGGSPARAEKPFSIYLMKTDGSAVRKLAHVDGYSAHDAPRFSHDGKLVTFDAQPANTPQRDCFIVNFDGSGLRKVCSGNNPDFSPDDKQIACDDQRQIYVQNLDGEGRVQIAQGYCPRWSPDGGQLAFLNGKMVYVLDIGSGEQIALFDKPFLNLYRGCSWSPDGKMISCSGRPDRRERRYVSLVSPKGQEHGLKVRLKNEGSGQMAFSPDSKQLAIDNQYKIWICSVDGNDEPKQLPDQVNQNRDPDWSPDGQWLVFTSNRD